TALFVDVVGSTALARRTSPRDLVQMLNEFFAVVIDAVGAEQGWVNKFEGDAALCVFGAPSVQPDHPERALKAAARLVEGLDRLARRYPELRAGIGVATGTAVAGNIGS